ncbi:MAG: hypothetical protein RLZZ34_2416, partial [Verrucomicrobiota bacterium]
MNSKNPRMSRHTLPRLAGIALLTSWQLLGADPTWITGVTEPIKDVTLAFPIVGVVGARPLEEGTPV